MGMGLFGAIIRTAVNVATLPVDVVKDVVTLGGVATENGKSSTLEKLKQIKREADEDYNDYNDR
jgi:hypothetical protein